MENQHYSNDKQNAYNLCSSDYFVKCLYHDNNFLSKLIAKNRYIIDSNNLKINSRISGAMGIAKNQPAAKSVKKAEYTLSADVERITSLTHLNLQESKHKSQQ